MKLSDELPPRCRVFFWPLDGCPSLPSIATEIVFFQINAGGSDTSGGRRATERLLFRKVGLWIFSMGNLLLLGGNEKRESRLSADRNQASRCRPRRSQ